MNNYLKDNYYRVLNRIKLVRKHIVIFNKLIDKVLPKPIVKDSEDTVIKILSNGVSISRYGDGEFKLINKKNLLFQKYDKELSNRLKEIIKSDLDNHIVCIPRQLVDTDWLNDRAKYYWDNYLNLNRYKIYKLLNKNKVYYDAFITRFYIDLKDKNKSKQLISNLKNIWNGRKIVIVEGDNSRLGVGNDLFEKCLSIERILCPSENSFSKYEEILNQVKKVDKSKLILIALGPTATVLAYDLAKLGYNALDIGHIDIEYEWFLKGVHEKCPINNKYVGEAVNGVVQSNYNDEKYINEIIYDVN